MSLFPSIKGDWVLAQNSASDAMKEIELQRLHHDSIKGNSNFLAALDSSELAAFQARAKARKENNELQEAMNDLTSALRLNPNNREIRKMLIKVKEDLATTANSNKKETWNNNNNESCEQSKSDGNIGMLPIGSNISQNFKYVDDSASQMSEVSSVTYQSKNQ